jgi:hypothetical protein
LDASTPDPAVALPLTVTGGQALAQASVQIDASAESPVRRYNVMPLPSTRMVPSGESAVETVTAALIPVS